MGWWCDLTTNWTSRTTFRLEIKSHQSTHFIFSRIEHTTKTYRINSLISFMTTPRFKQNLRNTFNLNMSETLMLNRFRFLQHNYRNCLRFDRLKYLHQKLSFRKQQRRSRSQRLNERSEVKERSSLRYVLKTSSLDSERRSLLRRLKIKLRLYT